MLEKYFEVYRNNTIGINHSYLTPFGKKEIIYADWIASGRLYKPIEDKLSNEIGPFVANTHTETSETGKRLTLAYHEAQHIIKKHVHAGPNDVIISAGSGMTTVINKFQRILGFRHCGMVMDKQCLKERERPVVFITHMEHHSNHTSWYASMADVEIIRPTKDLLVDLNDLEEKLIKYKNRTFKVASVTACSNVTGIRTPYYEIAKIMHKHGGLCFVDFAASAPYDNIDMHPSDPYAKLDAIFFSPHKFLGGPGSSGILIFDRAMYHNSIPDQPGGGTVDWTNPWGEYKFVDDIEAREDGGTPAFLQTIKAALAIKLKEQMTVDKIHLREEFMVEYMMQKLQNIDNLKILASEHSNRLPVFSFYHPEIHYNLIVRLLSDYYGIQVRGGCACAGTYGHFLLEVSHEKSKAITEKINRGDLSEKPGWVRLSLHPILTNKELDYIANAIKEIVQHYKEMSKNYSYNNRSNEYFYIGAHENHNQFINEWFNL
ncbi:MAG TPA: aminotransferase class V-fold PLP-dependent enzyme [Bacteroidales bacterium]|jgi:selenocysteine lyase/cysteine desulfurase|nr:aminotransferase class V-fold PLP-dependent enzyme [Bacteroidales bacterium]